MTDYHKLGFLSKCAEMGVPETAALNLYKRAGENGLWSDVTNFAQNAWSKTKNAFGNTVASIKKDPFNNAAVPGMLGMAGGALLYNTLLRNPDDSSSEKRRKMILYSLLGSALATGAKANGYGGWMPEFSFTRTN